MDQDTPCYDGENTGVPLRVEEVQKEGYLIPNMQKISTLGTCQVSGHRGSDVPRFQVALLPWKAMQPNYLVTPHLGKLPFFCKFCNII